MTGFGKVPELHEGGTLCLLCDRGAPPGEEIAHADWCKPVPPHVQRMREEYKELDEKWDKLAIFMSSNPVYDTMDDIDRYLMKAQLNMMGAYQDILALRLDRA